MRSGLIDMAQLGDMPFFARFRDEALAEHPGLADQPERRLLFETIRRMLSQQVYDVIDATACGAGRCAAGRRRRGAIAAAAGECRGRRPRAGGVAEALPVRAAVSASAGHATTDRAREVVAELFAAYTRRAERSCRPNMPTPADLARAVADYIAGMTDRFALREHERLTGRRAFPAH